MRTALEPLQQRDYQDRVVDKSVGFFKGGENSVLIESPTGSGKTIIGLRICQHLAELYGWRANWVAMRRNLLAQVADMNARYFGLEGLTPVSMFDKDPPQAEVTVVDEAQHDAAASCSHIHAQSGSRVILGLSATPYRTDRLKLAFRRVVRDAGIHRLITEGWLAPFEHWSVDNWDVAHVASVYLRERAKWGKTVAFFHRVEQCLEFAAILAGAGRHCEVITADTDRESQLDDFESGRFDVVANVGILNEGFDCPPLRTVFVRDASKLPTIQMAGRAFRLDPETGKTHCNVVQSGHARWQFTRTARPRQSHALRGGRWVTLGNSVMIDEVARENMGRIAAIQVSMPKYLSAEAQKKRHGAARGRGRRRRFQREPNLIGD